MAIWAIVPVKPLRRGKSRLADTLNEDERAELNSQLLKHTLETLKESPRVEETLVVSRDPKVLAIANDLDARTIREDGSPELLTLSDDLSSAESSSAISGRPTSVGLLRVKMTKHNAISVNTAAGIQKLRRHLRLNLCGYVSCSRTLFMAI